MSGAHDQAPVPPDSVSSATPQAAKYGLESDEIAKLRQSLCMCLFNYVLKEADAHSVDSAIALDEARERAFHYLLQCMHEVPEEFNDKSGHCLQELLLNSTEHKLLLGSGHARGKLLVFKAPVVHDLAVLSSATSVEPNGGTERSSPVPASNGKHHDDTREGSVRSYSAEPPGGSPQAGHSLSQGGDNSQGGGTSIMDPVALNAMAKAAAASAAISAAAGPSAQLPSNAPPHERLRSAVLRHMHARKAYDGPKSQAVEGMRLALKASLQLDDPRSLESLTSFQAFLEQQPEIYLWRAKKSDTLRCILKGMPEGADAASDAVSNAASDDDVVCKLQPGAAEMICKKTSLYSAVHVLLTLLPTPATSPATGLSARRVREAMLGVSEGRRAQWRTHPGLKTESGLLHFLGQDVAIKIPEYQGPAESATLYLDDKHADYQKILKEFNGDAGQPAAGSKAAATKEVAHALNGAPNGAHYRPKVTRTDYGAIGATIELWGPTHDSGVQRQFFAEHGHEQAWGIDCKFVGSELVLFVVSTSNACLLWDVSSAECVPAELNVWLADRNKLKCRGGASVLVNALYRMLYSPRGFLQLQKLYAAYTGKDAQNAKLPHIIKALFGVHIVPNAGMEHSNWNARPLTMQQVRYIMHGAWLHANVVEAVLGHVSSSQLADCMLRS